MTFPTGTVISTDNLDSPTDNPNLARQDLLELVQRFNQLVASQNIASGVLILNGSGKVAATYLPSNFTQSGTISLQPGSGIVNVSNVLRLQQVFTSDLGGAALGTDSPQGGDMVYLVDGDAGQPCIGVYDGAQWRVVILMTQVGSVGAALTTTSTLTAQADL